MCWYQELIANTGALKEALALKVMVTKVNMIRSNCSSQSVTKQLVLWCLSTEQNLKVQKIWPLWTVQD